MAVLCDSVHRQLELNQPVLGSVKRGEVSRYSLRVPAHSFFVVNTDVAQAQILVTLRNSKGETLAQRRPPESLLGTSVLAGLAEEEESFTIELAGETVPGGVGLYELRLHELRPLVPGDADRLKAEAVFAQALENSRLGTPETALKSALSVAGACHQQQDARCLLREHFLTGLFRSAGNADKDSQAELEKALKYAADLTDAYAAATILKEAVVVAGELGDYKKAEEMAREATVQADRAGSGLLVAQSNSQYCRLLVLVGNYARSEPVCRKAVEAAKSKSAAVLEADALVDLGTTLLLKGDLTGEDMVLSTDQIYVAYGLPLRAAWTLDTVTAMRLRRSDYQGALELAEKARKIYVAEPGKALSGEAVNLKLLAKIYSALNDPGKAADAYARGAEISRALNDRGQEANDLMDQANAQMKQGNLKGSLDTYYKSLALSRELHNPGPEAVALTRIAELLNRSGDVQGSERSYQEAWALYGELRNLPEQARICLSLGGLAKSRHDFEAAKAQYRRAIDEARESGARFEVAVGRGALGEVLGFERKYGEARTELKASLDLIESLRAPIAAPGPRMSWFERTQRIYEAYLYLLMEMHQREPDAGYDREAFQVAERTRARVLLERMPDLRETWPPDLAAREQTLRKQMRQLGTPKDAAERQALRALESKYDEIYDELNMRDPRYRLHASPPVLSAADAANQLLDADSALLEYKVCEEKSFAWLVKRDGVHSVELPGRQALAKLLDPLKKATQDETIYNARRYWEAVGKISQAILAPLAGQLKGRKLFLVADGVLQRVPWAGLPWPGAADPAKAGILLERFEISNLPSASTAAAMRKVRRQESQAPKTIAIFADAVYRTLPQLTDSRAEALAIAKLTPAGKFKLFLGTDASPAAAIAADLGNYRMIHFAAHALVDEAAEPEQSRIVLSEMDSAGKPQTGALNLLDIYRLKLDADMVSLSACESAAGKDMPGEGLLAVSRAFLYAGARRVLGTHWKVDDSPAKQFMIELYGHILGPEHEDPAVALRVTQLAFWRRGLAPKKWAAFVMIGPY